MARPVEPQDPAQAPAAPQPPPVDLLPELQAKIELATRTLAILERRIAAWESELAEVKTELRERAPSTQVVESERMADLEARLARLERRQLRQQARDQAQAALSGGGGPAIPAIAQGGEAEDSRAVVFARWSSTEAQAGEIVKLSAMVDGFVPGEEISFHIVALDGSPVGEPVKIKVGEKDTVDFKWKAPAPGARGSADFYFEASGGGHVARSPVLTVTKV
ncbi:MAG: hypothetical protein R3F60_23400 [bacterium]